MTPSAESRIEGKVDALLTNVATALEQLRYGSTRLSDHEERLRLVEERGRYSVGQIVGAIALVVGITSSITGTVVAVVTLLLR